MNEIADGKSPLRIARRVLIVILLVALAGCILSQGYFSYAYGDPTFSVPRPSEGRVHPIVVGGFGRYVNELEYKRYDFAIHKLMWADLAIFAILMAFRISVKEF
jgi:hypothetical protein